MFELLTYILIEANKNSWVDRISILLSTLTIGVLTWTLYFVWQYTKATKTQTDELIKQRRLSNLPYFVHHFQCVLIPEKNEGDLRLTVTNIGNGIAIGISAMDFKLPDGTVFKFSQKNFIKKQEKTNLNGFSDDKISSDPAELNRTFFNTGHKKSTYEVTITFQDIEGSCYKQKIQSIKGQIIQSAVELI